MLARTGKYMKDAPLIRMKGMSKNFGAVQALDKVDFEINRAEIVGLAGDNGAGKSTLVRILAGVYPSDEGSIFLEGNEVTFSSPREAIEHGIESIYQDLALFEDMNLARNIFVGREPARVFLGGLLKLLDKKRMDQETLQALDSVKIGLRNTEQIVGTLSGGERQSVAVARALHFRAKVLIMDEPTAALSLKESRKILGLAKELRKEGLGVVVITHNLHQMFSIVDRVTVLRHGRQVGNKEIERTSMGEIEELILGEEEEE
jgi:simple sugar transport system ATP-binding protein